MTDKQINAWTAKFAKVIAEAPGNVEVYWDEPNLQFVVYRYSETPFDECSPSELLERKVAAFSAPFYFGVLS